MIDDPDALRIETSRGIVRIWHARAAADLQEVERVLGAIETELRRTGAHHLLFDSRDADRACDAVQQRIWSFLSGHPQVRRVAVLMVSKDRDRIVRLMGAERGVCIKPFTQESSATHWLLHG